MVYNQIVEMLMIYNKSKQKLVNIDKGGYLI